MLAELTRLIELEKADREVARLNQEVAALPKRVAAIEAKLNDSKAHLDAARNAIKQGDAQKRKLEQEIQAEQQKISKYREQSLDVKTNEQYKALMHEISFAEQAIRNAEDKILELMIGAEAQEKLAKQAEAELKEETAEIEREKSAARAITAEDEKQLAVLKTKRDELRGGIADEHLRHYDRVFKLRGSAIAEARDHKCSVCQVMLRPQTWNELRAGESVLMCDSCQRILWYDASKEPAQPAPPKREATPAQLGADDEAPAAAEAPAS